MGFWRRRSVELVLSGGNGVLRCDLNFWMVIGVLIALFPGVLSLFYF